MENAGGGFTEAASYKASFARPMMAVHDRSRPCMVLPLVIHTYMICNGLNQCPACPARVIGGVLREQPLGAAKVLLPINGGKCW